MAKLVIKKKVKKNAGRMDRPRQPGTAQAKVVSGINSIARATSNAVQLPKPSALPPYVHCLIDPINAPAARLPDEYVSATGAHKLVLDTEIASDANGRFAFAVTPALVSSLNLYTLTGTTTAASAGTSLGYSDYAEINSSYSRGRVVVYAIEIEYIGAPLNASGRLSCIEVDDYLSIASTNMATLADDGDSDPLINGRVVHVRPIMPPRFATPSSTIFMNDTFHTWAFYGTGAPISTAVISVRVTAHFEGVAKKGGLHAKSGSVELYNPDHLTIGANIARNGIIAAASEAGRKFMKDSATKAANLAWANLGPQVANTMARYGGRGMLAAGESLLAIMP